MVFYSCEKEIIDKNSNTLPPTNYNIFPAEMRTSNPELEFVRFPPLDLYKYVLLELYSDSVFLQQYETLSQNWGHPRINFATINVTSDTEYALTLPLVKDNEITSFIFYFANGTYGHFSFAPVDLGISLLNQSPTNNIDPLALLTLVKFSNYQATRNSRYFTAVNDWIIEYLDHNNNSHSADERTVVLSYSVEAHRYFDEDGVHIVYDWVHSIVPCELGPSGGGGFSVPDFELPGSNSGGSSSTSGLGDEKPRNNPINPFTINDDCHQFLLTDQALEYLNQLGQNNFVFCDSELTTEELIENLLEIICDEGEIITIFEGGSIEIPGHLENITITYENINNTFNDLVAEEDYVIMNNIRDCPKLKCLMDILTGDDFHPLSTNIICEYLDAFLGDDLANDRNLIIGITSFEDQPNIISNANAFVTVDNYNYLTPQITMYFNSDKCETLSTFSLLETFFHELIHADIYRRLIEDYGWTNYDDNEHAFSLLLKEMGYDGVNWEDQHELMLAHYIELMTRSLWEANGRLGSPNDYAGIVLHGFPLDILYESGWFSHIDAIGHDKVYVGIQELLDHFYSNVGIHKNFNACD